LSRIFFFSKHCQTSPGFSWPHFHRIFSPLRLFSALRTLQATERGLGFGVAESAMILASC
jgi:hypothetical protein